MSERFADGVALHQAGRLAEAERVYARVLSLEPGHAGAMHLMGVLAVQRGDFRLAALRIREAIAREPGNFEMHLNLGEALRRGGVLTEAAEVLRRAVAILPENAFGHYNLAVTLTALGSREEAIGAFERALSLKPAFPEALNNLGLLLAGKGDHVRAAAAFEKAVEYRPGHVEAWNNVGLSWWELGRHEQALRAFEQAAALRGDFAPAQVNRAFALRRLGKRHEAVTALRRAAQIDPSRADVWRDLGMALLEVGEPKEALEACRRAATLAPENAEASHALGVALAAAGERAAAVEACERGLKLRPGMKEWEFELAALKGEQPARVPDAFVRTLFDEYAVRFEGHLVGELKYHVPWDLLRVVLALRDQGVMKPGPWDVLDLGCGTGLVGELFRPHARRVVGCDLSGKMCEMARGRQRDGAAIFDEVVCGHIVGVMQERVENFDVILAGDVFIYTGALEEVFGAAARSLRRGGVLAFSLEHWAGEGFGLGEQRRFGHSPAYVERVGGAAGFRQVHAERVRLRADVVDGWILAMQRG